MKTQAAISKAHCTANKQRRKHRLSHSNTRPENRTSSNFHPTSHSTYYHHPTSSTNYYPSINSTNHHRHYTEFSHYQHHNRHHHHHHHSSHHHHQKRPDVPTHTRTTTHSAHPATHSTSNRPRGYPKPLGLGRGFPVVSRRFLHSTPSIYAIYPSSSPNSPVYHVRDIHQRVIFRVDRSRLCLHDVHVLHTHSTNRPWLYVRGFFLSARSVMTITDINGRPVLILQKMSVISMKKRVLHGYTSKVGGKPDLVITSDHKARTFSFRDRRSNEVAHAKRRRDYPSNEHPGKSYKMYISPGYDNALFMMCMICIIQTWNP